MIYTQLRSFHAVAREGSVTAASRVIGVSQPTITTQIKALEQSYGVALFHRGPRGLELTDLGRDLLLKTQKFFGAEDEIAELLEAATKLQHGHLKIGAVGPYHVMRMISQFSARYPSIHVSIDLGNSRDIARRLVESRVDIAVLSQISPSTELWSMPFMRHRVVAFVASGHPWTKKRDIRLKDLEKQRLLIREEGSTTRRAFESALSEAGIKCTSVLEIGSREAVYEAVAEGLGIGIVSDASIGHDARVHALVIRDAEVYTYTHVACLKDRRDTRLIGAFFDIIEAYRWKGVP